MIFCDMDGVLVDFNGGFSQNFGIKPSDLPRRQLWQKVINTENYWSNLPKAKNADKLIDFLNQYDFCILTGLPAYGYDKAEKEKRLWMKKHYNKEKDVICCLSKDKQNFGKQNDILIDDFERNIQKWEEMGGIGILHTSVENTIKQLKELI